MNFLAAERPIRGSRCSTCARHFVTSFRAFPAGFRALLTVIHLVLCAFLAARVADLCAELADLLRELRAARHLARRKRADVRATAIELDAAGHHFHVLFVQASGRTVLASFHALVTRLDTIFIFFVRHILCGLMPPQPVAV